MSLLAVYYILEWPCAETMKDSPVGVRAPVLDLEGLVEGELYLPGHPLSDRLHLQSPLKRAWHRYDDGLRSEDKIIMCCYLLYIIFNNMMCPYSKLDSSVCMKKLSIANMQKNII